MVLQVYTPPMYHMITVLGNACHCIGFVQIVGWCAFDAQNLLEVCIRPVHNMCIFGAMHVYA
jgi:hypothetical protein